MVVQARSSKVTSSNEGMTLTRSTQGDGSNLSDGLFYLKDINDPAELWPDVRREIPIDQICSGREEEFICSTYDGHRQIVTNEQWKDLAQTLGWKLVDEASPGKGVKDPKSGFIFAPEAGGSSIEAIMPPLISTREAQLLFLKSLQKMIPWCERHEICVVKYSAQLLDIATDGLDTTKGIKRYLILNAYFKNALGSLARFCDISSHQSQVCVGVDNFIQILNLSFFTPVFVALGGNCPIMDGKDQGQTAARLDVWTGLDDAKPNSVNRCGLAPLFEDWAEYRDWVCSLDAIMIKTGDGPDDYVATDKTFGELGFPSMQALRDALAGLSTSIWTHFRLKMPAPGVLTVESRATCQQPFDGSGEAMAALLIGLTANYQEATAYRFELQEKVGGRFNLERLCNEWLESAQSQGTFAVFNKRLMNSVGMIHRVLKIAQKGLEMRNLGEESALYVLWQRLNTGITPAVQTRRQWVSGGAKAIIAANSVHTNADVIAQQITALEQPLHQGL